MRRDHVLGFQIAKGLQPRARPLRVLAALALSVAVLLVVKVRLVDSCAAKESWPLPENC